MSRSTSDTRPPTHRLKDFAKTEKPWGGESLIDHNSWYALKEIHMTAGTRSSLQSHKEKHETMYVLSGEIELETVDSSGAHHFEIFRPGEAYALVPNTVHRVKVLRDARLIEVSTPQLDDVIRHSDDYGRS